MKVRLFLPLLTMLALLAVPLLGTAEEGVAKKECAKCCDKAKCEKCEKGQCPHTAQLDGILCPISGKAIDKEVTANYHGGKIFFCCDHCLAAWQKDAQPEGAKKFVAQANYQLLATGQVQQKGCPISGKPTKDGTAIQVGANKAEVRFCCNHCKKNALEKKGADQIAMLFGEKAFANAFELVKQEKKEAAVQ